MITYKQLSKGLGKTRKNLWYLCGDDSALVSDVLEMAKSYVYAEVNEVCLGVFFKEDIKELREFIVRPYFEERKLIVIYDASQIINLASIIDTTDPSTFYIIVDYGVTAPPDSLNELLTKNSKAKAVNCSVKASEELSLLINGRLNISEDAHNALLGRANGDSEWLLNKILILEQMPVDIVSKKLVELICTDTGLPKFENSLIQFDKQLCFLYIKDIGVDDISINKIIRDTHNLALLNTAVVDSRQTRLASDKSGLSTKQVSKYAKYVPYYDGSTTKKNFSLLMRLYSKLIERNKAAYLALVNGW